MYHVKSCQKFYLTNINYLENKSIIATFHGTVVVVVSRLLLLLVHCKSESVYLILSYSYSYSYMLVVSQPVVSLRC